MLARLDDLIDVLDVAMGGVVSPGGVGFDISCGVRLLLSSITEDELRPRRDQLMDALAACTRICP